MTDDNEPRWVHDCSRCGVTVPSDRCEQDCPVCQVAMAADKAELPGFAAELPGFAAELPGFAAELPGFAAELPGFAAELARKQRVVDAIGQFFAKPAKPTTFRRWRRPGFR